MSTRWLSLESAVSRSLKIYPSLKSYFLSEDNAAPRFVRLKEHFEDQMTEVYLRFYQSALQPVIKLNLKLQRDEPLISRLHGEIKNFLKKLAAKFVMIPVITEPFQDIPYDRRENQKPGIYFINPLLSKHVFHFQTFCSLLLINTLTS